MTVYYQPNQIVPGHYPAVLAIGDSWFWYPFASNLLAEISAVVKPDYSNILTLGKNGATLRSFAIGAYAAAFARELVPANAQYYSAVLISGAGNDAVICDRFTVLRDGESVGTGAMASANLPNIIRLMVGREIKDIYPRTPHSFGEPLLELREVAGRTKPRLHRPGLHA